jgi:uncharacterized iron-regulated membrane protein
MEMTPEDMAALLEQGVGTKLTALSDGLEGLKKLLKDSEGFEGRIRQELAVGFMDVDRVLVGGIIAKIVIVIMVLVAICVSGHNGCQNSYTQNQVKILQDQVADVTRKLEALDAKNEPIMGFVAAEKAKRDEAERLVREAAQKAFEEGRDRVAACVSGATSAEAIAACTNTSSAEAKETPLTPPAASAPMHRVTNTLEEQQAAELARKKVELAACVQSAASEEAAKKCVVDPNGGSTQQKQ